MSPWQPMKSSEPMPYEMFEIFCNRNKEAEEREQNKAKEMDVGEKDHSTNSRFRTKRRNRYLKNKQRAKNEQRKKYINE